MKVVEVSIWPENELMLNSNSCIWKDLPSAFSIVALRMMHSFSAWTRIYEVCSSTTISLSGLSSRAAVVTASAISPQRKTGPTRFVFLVSVDHLCLRYWRFISPMVLSDVYINIIALNLQREQDQLAMCWINTFSACDIELPRVCAAGQNGSFQGPLNQRLILMWAARR
jgi:hypothetical protein